MISIDVPKRAFNDIYVPHLTNYSRVQIYYGGSGSGKSKFLAQRCVIWLMQGKRNILVCRAIGRTIRKSVFNEIVKVIRSWNLTALFSINKTDGVITCRNGYQIIFTGLDDVEKVKSITPEKGVITDIWVEEATETEFATIKQLLKRQRGGDEKISKTLTLSFNPILQDHWIYETYFAPIGWTNDQTEYTSPELTILKTWYIHNRFLTPDDIADLLKETDKYYQDVYTFGNWGVLGNVIFTNWRVADLSKLRDQFTNRRNGLDFGYADDPAALVATHYDRARKIIYIFDGLYESGLTNDVLAEEMLKIIDRDRVICDSAEPKSIAELRQYHVNAKASKKGRDSVVHGIQWLQQQTIVVDKKLIDVINELRQFHWKENAGGKIVKRGGLPVPQDWDDHAISATRYAYEDDMIRARVKSDKFDLYARSKGTHRTTAARSDDEIEQLLKESVYA